MIFQHIGLSYAAANLRERKKVRDLELNGFEPYHRATHLRNKNKAGQEITTATQTAEHKPCQITSMKLDPEKKKEKNPTLKRSDFMWKKRISQK